MAEGRKGDAKGLSILITAFDEGTTRYRDQVEREVLGILSI